MKKIFIFLLFISKISFAQKNENFPLNFTLENNLKTENILNKYSQFDFSTIWLKTDNTNIYGIIGYENQRIRIKILSVKKDSNNPNKYLVFGKSNVKATICDFSGYITFKKIYKVDKMHFGLDDEYSEKRIKSQGILIADYEFKEDKKQINSGIFKGKLYTKFYLNSENQIKYDDIEINSDNYYNNAFVGIWNNFNQMKQKNCNWADYRVPNSRGDFDIGIGEFNVSLKYANVGWMDVILKNQTPNLNIIRNETTEKSKEWWE